MYVSVKCKSRAEHANLTVNLFVMSSPPASKLDSDSWGVVHGYLSTPELIRLKAISLSWKGLLAEGALSPAQVMGTQLRSEFLNEV